MEELSSSNEDLIKHSQFLEQEQLNLKVSSSWILHILMYFAIRVLRPIPPWFLSGGDVQDEWVYWPVEKTGSQKQA